MPLGTAPSDDVLQAAAARLGEALRQRGWRIATAESCTGGLIGHAITSVPGSSDYYVGGVICYWDRAKEVELGVSHELIEAHGAVSPEVAEAMLQGVFAEFPSATRAIAITGLSGPDGDGEGKPVGLTYVAVASRGGPVTCERQVFGHDRDGNKRAAALMALRLAAAE